MGLIAKYRLKKNLPQLKAGVIFEHRDYDNNHPDRGNYGSGVMILGWVNGSCQDAWCGETFIMPGQLAKNREWFEPVEMTEKEQKLAEITKEKEEILAEIEKLRKRVNQL